MLKRGGGGGGGFNYGKIHSYNHIAQSMNKLPLGSILTKFTLGLSPFTP